MSKRILAGAGAVALACACSGATSKPVEMGEVRVAAVFSTPIGVSCIQIVASAPARTTTRSFGVSPGQSTVSLLMTGVPTGQVVFSGAAFSDPCSFVTNTTIPNWIADDVSSHVTAAQPVDVQLNFRGNGTANVGVNFGGDDYTVTTVAGEGGVQGTTDTPARFAGPNSAALSGDGRTLYVGDRNDGVVPSIGMAIRAVDLASGAVTTLAGSLTAAGTDDGPGSSARFARLFSVVLSGSTLLISDRCAIRSMSTLPPYAVTTLIGTRTAAGTNWNCSPAVTPLGVQDLDLAVRGNLVFVADSSRFTVHQVDFSTSPPAITTVAGVTDTSGTDDGTIATAHLAGPTGLVFPFVGNDVFYLIDTSLSGLDYGLIRRISIFEDSVFTVAGAGQASFVSVDGLGTHALFAQPRRAVSDGTSLYIGDAFSVRRMDIFTSSVVTLAGDGANSGFADGTGSAARFNAAFGVARDPRNGVIYIADQGNFAIRKLTPP